jgi:hypothetical protein
MTPLARPLGVAVAVALAMASVDAAAGPCPKIVVTVDHDKEVKPENWATYSVGACQKTFRYLSKYTPNGDGSKKGKAIWKPSIPEAGMYEVVVSYRATSNRTDDADYRVEDDAGKVFKTSIDQRKGGDCTLATLGTFWCVPGGACRVVLDGTDDSKSDAADATTFTRVSCDPPSDAGPPPGRCDGIRAHAKWEVCEESPTTCRGVFDDGAGCAAYCAAAGMTCVGRWGGSAGCNKEADGGTIPCDADNGHQSDWCECEGPAPVPDAGPPPEDAGPPPDDAGAGGAMGEAGAGQGGAAGVGGGAGTGVGGSPGVGGAGFGGVGLGGAGPAGGAAAGSEGHGVDEGDAAVEGCGCRAATAPVAGRIGVVAIAFGLLAAARRRARRGRSDTAPRSCPRSP